MKTYTIALKIKKGNSFSTRIRVIKANDRTYAACTAMTDVEETLKDNEILICAKVISEE